MEQAHQDVRQLSTTTAHQGLLEEQCASPIPLAVLGQAQGRLSTPDALERQVSRALFPRTTHRDGCVTLPRYPVYGEDGLPNTPVLVWLDGNALRVVCDNVVRAESHCRYDLRHRQVKDMREGRFYVTRFASPEGSLIPFPPQEALGLYRPKLLRRQARRPFPAQQLCLFERMETASSGFWVPSGGRIAKTKAVVCMLKNDMV